MNITSINNLSDISKYRANSVTVAEENRNATFEHIFEAAMNMVKETNHYTNKAEEAEMAYALGITDNPLDLQIAQQKANMSLQYTIAVRNHVLDAYKEIMNLQF